MKKMIAIIIVLLIIFISMAIYKYVIVVNNQIKIEDVNKIEEYISKIYCWKEVTDEALDSENSIVIDQAENRLTAMRALLVYFMDKLEETTEICKKNLNK